MNMMLTNNFYSYLRTILLTANKWSSSMTSTTGGSRDILGTIIDLNGDEQASLNLGGTSDYPKHEGISLNAWESGKKGRNYRGYSFFIPGNGQDPLSENDYSIKGGYEADVHYNASWYTTGDAMINKNGKGEITFLVNFTAIEDIFLTEIGLAKTIPTNNSNTASSVKAFSCLFGRTLLDRPITLLAGESASFQIKIEL